MVAAAAVRGEAARLVRAGGGRRDRVARADAALAAGLGGRARAAVEREAATVGRRAAAETEPSAGRRLAAAAIGGAARPARAAVAAAAVEDAVAAIALLAAVTGLARARRARARAAQVLSAAAADSGDRAAVAVWSKRAIAAARVLGVTTARRAAARDAARATVRARARQTRALVVTGAALLGHGAGAAVESFAAAVVDGPARGAAGLAGERVAAAATDDAARAVAATRALAHAAAAVVEEPALVFVASVWSATRVPRSPRAARRGLPSLGRSRDRAPSRSPPRLRRGPKPAPHSEKACRRFTKRSAPSERVRQSAAGHPRTDRRCKLQLTDARRFCRPVLRRHQDQGDARRDEHAARDQGNGAERRQRLQ